MKHSTAFSASAAAAVIGVLALMSALASGWNDSLIVDEVPHIGAGYSYVVKGDMRLNPEHPPLVKDLAGLALLPLGLNQTAFSMPQWTTETNGQWTFGRALIYGTGNNPDTVTHVARLPILLNFAIAMALVWRWGRERAGVMGGLLGLIVFGFSPTVLAHARFVTTDVAAAMGSVLATYAFVHYLRAPSRKTFWYSVLGLGVAFLCKFNTVLLGPLFIAAALLWSWQNQGANMRSMALWVGRTALVGLGAIALVVWPVYALHTLNYPPERQRADTQTILGAYSTSALNNAVVWMSDKPILRSLGQWGLGLAMVQQRSAGGNTIYWLGSVVKEGGPWYFPIVYILKEPLAWLILMALAMGGLLHHARRGTPVSRTHFFDEKVWLMWIALYWAVSVQSTLNIGVRHLLPIYPFMALLVSGQLSRLVYWVSTHEPHRLRLFEGTLVVLVAWYIFSSASVFPHYLSYFNQLAGGPSNGYHYVVDSNLDWGQDAKRLGAWAKANDIPKVCLDYFGWADPQTWLKDRYVWTSSTHWADATDFLKRNQCDGWVAVSATFFQNSNGIKTFSDDGNKNTWRWLMDYTPRAVIGNSIFVWHIE